MRSVRARIAVSVAVGAALVLTLVALLAPSQIRSTLEDDLLRSEAESVDALLSFTIDEADFDTFVLDSATELLGDDVLNRPIDEVFGPSVDSGVFAPTRFDDYLALQISILDDIGRLDDIVEAANGPFVLALDNELAVVVDESGTIVELIEDPGGPGLPILASDELDQYLFADLGLVAIDGTTLIETVDARVVLRTVTVGGADYVVAADATAVDTSVTSTARWLWLGVPIGALGLGLLAWWLVGRALRPVAAITERAATISAGTLESRVPVPSTGDEVAELAQTVNGMLDRLEDDDRRRRRFVSDASHELRTPVAVIRNEAEVALEHPDRIDAEHLATAVADESRRLSGIVDDLLALARHDERSGGRLVEVDLDDVVLAESARARRVPVATTEVTAGRICGVPSDIGRLVAHLLDNAARHADRAVAVGVSSSDQEVVLTVDDDGPGVPPDRREVVFDRFARLDDARDRDGGGAGLGLAVAREIATRSGGSVEIDEAPLGGARFTVTFPDAAS